MTSRLRQHVTFANVGVIVALVLAGSGFAVAAIPGPGGVIKGCFNKRNGALRVLDAKKRCARSEKAIAWNQQGKPGVGGAAGASGPAGKPGSDAQFNGATAGGDLTGSYPNPQIRPGTVNGTHIAPNSLTGTSIDESTLAQVPDTAKLGGRAASGFTHNSEASGGAAPTPGGFGTFIGPGLLVTMTCTNSPVGNQVTLTNSTGGAVEVWIDDSRGLPGSTPHVAALANSASVSTDIDTTANVVRRVMLIVAGGSSGVTTGIVAVTRVISPQAFCNAAIHGLT
jgi:hypothetical protein